MTPQQYEATKHELGLTNAEVAAMLEVNACTIYRWLQRDKLPHKVALLLRTFMRLHASMSSEKFQELMINITKGV